MKLKDLMDLKPGARLKNQKTGREGFYFRLQGDLVTVLWDNPDMGPEDHYKEESWPIEEVSKA